MTQKGKSISDYEYILPRRTLRGSTDEMLEELDQLIQGLLAFRQLMARRKSAGRRTTVPGAAGPGTGSSEPSDDPQRT